MAASEGKSYWGSRAWMAASDDKRYGKLETESEDMDVFYW